MAVSPSKVTPFIQYLGNPTYILGFLYTNNRGSLTNLKHMFIFAIQAKDQVTSTSI